MTHKEAIEAAMRDESFQASCTRYAHGNGSSGSVAHAAITAYLTARDMVLVPRVIDITYCMSAGDIRVSNNGEDHLPARKSRRIGDLAAKEAYERIVAELDRREKRG